MKNRILRFVSIGTLLTLTGCGSEAANEIFSKQIEVFGLKVWATSGVSDEHVKHAANVMAEYLDSNEDGTANNTDVVAKLVENNARLVMFTTQAEMESLLSRVEGISGVVFQNLQADEMQLAGSGPNGFDASLEEILHLITQHGYAKAIPSVFGEVTGSEIANAMDTARGGQFLEVPTTYPGGAWYTYNDSGCEYHCQITEYTYWALTSLLGAQDYAGRLDQIKDEWDLNTAALVQANDTAVHAILTNAAHGLPTALPNGSYAGATFTVGAVTE